jgi:hypothetical protein
MLDVAEDDAGRDIGIARGRLAVKPGERLQPLIECAGI